MKFCNILRYGKNLKFETIVQFFRKIIQLNTVIILKSTNEYYQKIILKSGRKMDLYPAMYVYFNNFNYAGQEQSEIACNETTQPLYITTKDSTTIETINYPHGHPSHTFCEWIIQPEDHPSEVRYQLRGSRLLRFRDTMH